MRCQEKWPRSGPATVLGSGVEVRVVAVPDLMTKRSTKEGVGSPPGEIDHLQPYEEANSSCRSIHVPAFRRCGGPETQRTNRGSSVISYNN